MIRKHLGYGFLPNTLVWSILYSYVVCSVYLTPHIGKTLSLGVYAILVSFIILLFKKYVNALFLIYYLGLKILKRPQRLLIFSLYFVFYIAVLYFFSPTFSILPINFIIFIWLLCLLTIEFLFYKYKFFVTFIRITPRLYVDLIFKEVHTADDIHSYDVTPHYVDDLDLVKVDMTKFLFYNPKNHKNYFEDKIDYIDFSYEEDSKYINLKAYDKEDNMIWNEEFLYNSDEINEALLPLIVEIIMDIENL